MAGIRSPFQSLKYDKISLTLSGFLFHKLTKLPILALLLTLYSHIFSFLLYLHHMMLINIKLDISGCIRITFQGCRHHCASSFLMAQLKRSWQYWHSCLAESLWKTLFTTIRRCMYFCWLKWAFYNPVDLSHHQCSRSSRISILNLFSPPFVENLEMRNFSKKSWVFKLLSTF